MVEKKELFNEEIDDEEDEDAQKDKFLTFHLRGEDYGIDIRQVTEIIGIQKITEIPDMPEYIKGVINLRGKVLPVMDVRIRFKVEPREYDKKTCIIVVTIGEATVGLIVDSVSEVTNIPENQIEPPPKLSHKNSNFFIEGLGKVGEEVKILLDVNHLLYKEDMEQISSYNSSEVQGEATEVNVSPNPN